MNDTVTLPRELAEMIERTWRARLPLGQDNVIHGLIRLRLILAQQAEPAEPAPAQDETLADRMRAAGMMTVDEMLRGAPLDRFMRHAGVHDLDTYGQWLDMKCREFLSMQAKRDLNKDPENDMYEWVIAHAAVFQEARINFNAARPAQTEQQPEQSDISADRAYRNGLQQGYNLGSIGDHARFQAVMNSYSREIQRAGR